MNPYSVNMMRSYHCFLALNGQDKGCAKYIDFASNVQTQTISRPQTPAVKENDDGMTPLCFAIVKGMKQQAFQNAGELAKTEDSMKIINEYIIPALDIVGDRFEKKTMFLPQLLMSAYVADD